jgi:ADP-ribose pyrophosphatase YjhB (NUDIX family)
MNEPGKKVSVIAPIELSTQKILAIRRAPEYNSYPGFDWAFVSETFEEEKDEGLIECASRGLLEELNIDVQPENLYDLGRVTENQTRCGLFIHALPKRDYVDIIPQEEEVADYRWVDFGEFLGLTQSSPFYLQNVEFILIIRRFLNNYPDFLF